VSDPGKLRDRLARMTNLEVPVAAGVASGIDESLRYLGSDAALRSLEADPYWPKWDSPWWHMLLLFELGEARRIPERVVRAMVGSLNALPVKTFPHRPEDMPPGQDFFDTTCHCALGCMYQVLAATGIDVDHELGWIAPWFLRYQMADGGLTCEHAAYLVTDEHPSSMVGSVAPMEAMLLGDVHEARARFVDGAAAFLIRRRLMHGSATRANATEREREPRWLEACFPRFYLYDVLRGASLLTRWATVRGAGLPLAAVEPVIEHLLRAFPDGVVRLGRRSFEGANTRARDAAGARIWPSASSFPLLEAVSRIGEASPALTRQWAETRSRLIQLLDTQRLTE
jgi:hypothetical protein